VIPWPGRFAFTSVMFMVEGAVPLVADALSQLPPSTVLVASVQFSVPVPPLRTWTGWAGGVNPLLAREKLTWPGKSSKKVPPAGATVNDTGTVMVMVPLCEVSTICPVYVPAARVGSALTIARIFCGIPHKPQPLKLTLATDSQLPPVLVVAAYEKLKFAPLLVTVNVCGSGLAPLKTLVKDNGPTGENCWARSGIDKQLIVANATRTVVTRRGIHPVRVTNPDFKIVNGCMSLPTPD
jgi:hypothetical protein